MWRRCWPLLLLVGMGCNTAVGNYFANRGRDFDECFRVEVGACVGVGVGVRAAGLLDLGVGGYGGLSVGGVYGKPTHGDAIQAWFPIPTFILGTGHFDASDPSHECWIGLPALTSHHGFKARRWLWHERGNRGRWLRLHAFDIEVSVGVMPVLVRLGFSPGEFLDFLLGWFGVDIAGDDRALVETP